MPGDQHQRIGRGAIRDDGTGCNAVAAGLLQMTAAFSSIRLCRIDDDEEDGSVSTGSRDPPGQSSIYIPPGDHWVESYRLSTFANWPEETPVSKNDLAASGFYYTGYQDRVRCFSCGIAVDNWVLGDTGCDPKWHKSDCRMAAGHDESNVALLTTDLKRIFRELNRSALRNAGAGSQATSWATQQQSAVQQVVATNQGWVATRPLKSNEAARSCASHRNEYPVNAERIQSKHTSI